jgi:hypothetical protein
LDKFELGLHVGEIKAWCEAAKNDAKKMSLSAPFSQDEFDEIEPYMVKYAEINGVSYYLEKDLIQTDLFEDMDLSGIWVFIIYKDHEILDEYFKIKQRKTNLIKRNIYNGDLRKEIAFRFGKLLGYSDESIAGRWI